MCGDNGEGVTTPASESRKVRLENGGGVFKIVVKVFRNVANFFAADEETVNSCSNCGDLQIEGEWLGIPLPYKFSIKDAIDNGGVQVNGRKKLCDSCSSMGVKEFREKSKTPYNDSSCVLRPA